jgi:sensor histidine kinase YesM
VHIDVPWELRSVRIPALVIQPLVENAIKHGISECLSGGEVRISAKLQQSDHPSEHPSAVLISVVDTGIGVEEATFAHRRRRGFGLSNVEQRLQRYGGTATPLLIRSAPGSGTTVELQVSLQAGQAIDNVKSVKSL